MAYQSIHTGNDIDDGISINSIQNDRLTNLENKSNSYLQLSGGTMTGPINMNSWPISGLNVPTEDSQAANKGYVDENINQIKDDINAGISTVKTVLSEKTLNNVSSISLDISNIRTDPYPRVFVLELGQWNSSNMYGAVGLYRYTSAATECNAIILAGSSIVTSVTLSSAGIFTANFNSSISYVRLRILAI